MRKAQSNVTISLGPLMQMQGDFYPIKRSGADKEEGFKLACPHSTVADAHGVSQTYICEQHGVIGKTGECGRMRETSKDNYVLVDADEVAEAKKSELDKGMLVLVPHKIEEVEPYTYPLGNSYAFIPSAKNQLHAVLLAILQDPDAEYAFLGEIAMSRGGTKLVRLRAWNGNLVVTELLRPEDVNGISTDSATVEDKTVQKALQFIETLAEAFDPGDYASKTRQRIAELVAAKMGAPVPASSTPSTPKRSPEQDFEALLAASIEAVS
jgi:DNA end-binding protein Ku